MVQYFPLFVLFPLQTGNKSGVLAFLFLDYPPVARNRKGINVSGDEPALMIKIFAGRCSVPFVATSWPTLMLQNPRFNLLTRRNTSHVSHDLFLKKFFFVVPLLLFVDVENELSNCLLKMDRRLNLILTIHHSI